MAAKKKKKEAKSFLLRGMKWMFVGGLWAGIALGLLTAWYAMELPGIVESPHFERRSAITIHANDGSELARYGELKGVSVSLDAVPGHLVYAVMAVEDRRFYKHFGIDPVGLLRAMARNLKEGRVVQGGSTITQQLAKNLFLSQERTLKRKIQEALLAVWMERQLTKDEIMTAYLNRVYLGAGTYGVDAASQTYFDKPIHDISLYESAMLAGLLKAPSRYSPQSNPELAARRAKVVLSAMEDAGYITEKEMKSQSMRGQAALPKPSVGQGERYFTDWITADLSEMIGPTDRNLTIGTTLDPDIQHAAEEIFAEILRQNKDRAVTQGALIVMARDGAILAMIGGANFKDSQFNRATQARRPPGSAFKPFVFLAALEGGWRPYDRIVDAPLSEGKYRPENFENEYRGDVSLTDALVLSLNTSAVRLMRDVGVGNVINLAHKMGIRADLARDLSLALGSSGVPLIELVTAYGTMANDGTELRPYGITRITDDEDNLLYVHADLNRGSRAVSRYATGELRDMMEDVITRGTGQRARLPFPAAGKTGTSQGFRDAWFVGFTGQYVAGVWLGNDDNSPMKGVTGGGLPAEIWRKTMMAAHEKQQESTVAADFTSARSSDGSESFFSMIRNILN
ncbi:MAG: penicillin-binding protein [Alphaproteobacteria bacterium CG_4_9_14_3_um_filter_47_13]|nr:MAG: penicillin-binding protein [Alphaproteobacteria bacterium CG_4_9_14_3_um_filter_47_13]